MIYGDGLERCWNKHKGRKLGQSGQDYFFQMIRSNMLVLLSGIGVVSYAFRHFPGDHPGYFSYSHIIRNCCGVTAACLMMRKRLFEEIGGFDEDNLSVAYNDVDLCLRLIEKGYYNIFTPYAELYHYESLSRGYEDGEDLERKYLEKFQRSEK